MARRVTVRSPVNGREIGRGTIVRWHYSDETAGEHAPVGIVEKLIEAGHSRFSVRRASVIFQPARFGGLRGTAAPKDPWGRCTRRACLLDQLEPIGEAKRVPKCRDTRQPAGYVGDGYWVRPGNRKHRVRENEIGRQIRQWQNLVEGRRYLENDPISREYESRLVRLDRKLERLPTGPRRKHR